MNVPLILALCIIVACYAMFHVNILQPYIAGCVCTSEAKMEGKTVIITGSNSGIGKETALDLAKRGARVVLACRNLAKAEVVRQEIVEKTKNTNVVSKHLDLASLTSVRAFAADINRNEPRVDVLINNAGVLGAYTLMKTADGFEISMGVNHLGHFLLTNLLLDLLKRSSPSRVIVVSSYTHRDTKTIGFDFENINAEISYETYDAYCRSKLANILFTRELARRLEDTGVTANSLHPGVIATGIFHNRPKWQQDLFHSRIVSYFTKTTEQGAQTIIHLAVSEELKGVSGSYFSDCEQKIPSEAAQDDQAAKKLWKVSAKLVGLDTVEQNND